MSPSLTRSLSFLLVFGLHQLLNINIWLFCCDVFRYVHKLVANFGFKSFSRCKHPLTLSGINADGEWTETEKVQRCLNALQSRGELQILLIICGFITANNPFHVVCIDAELQPLYWDIRHFSTCCGDIVLFFFSWTRQHQTQQCLRHISTSVINPSAALISQLFPTKK